MKYLNKKFSTPPNSKEFVDNWDAVFGEKPKPSDDKPQQVDETPKDLAP
jgi:hypothetical protein